MGKGLNSLQQSELPHHPVWPPGAWQFRPGWLWQTRFPAVLGQGEKAHSVWYRCGAGGRAGAVPAVVWVYAACSTKVNRPQPPSLWKPHSFWH